MRRTHQREVARLHAAIQQSEATVEHLRGKLRASNAALQAHVKGLNGPLHNTITTIEAALNGLGVLLPLPLSFHHLSLPTFLAFFPDKGVCIPTLK